VCVCVREREGEIQRVCAHMSERMVKGCRVGYLSVMMSRCVCVCVSVCVCERERECVCV